MSQSGDRPSRHGGTFSGAISASVARRATPAGADWVFELGNRINRLLAVEAAARELQEAVHADELSSVSSRTWPRVIAAADELRKVLDA